ncbi:MAG TPA: molybdenum cofactor guanylyltransferase, partial [Thermoplasmata archaeon]|nr:molybdenum cofactor guanylyltransferase [Thermoplasmata archaeon]
GGRHEPLHAVYSAQALPEWERCLGEGKLRPIQAYERLDIRLVSEEECRATDPDLLSLVNLNTPEELDSWERKLRGSAPR